MFFEEVGADFDMVGELAMLWTLKNQILPDRRSSVERFAWYGQSEI